jgi:hypothetical protein
MFYYLACRYPVEATPLVGHAGTRLPT